jgi:hypothetical protein
MTSDLPDVIFMRFRGPQAQMDNIKGVRFT